MISVLVSVSINELRKHGRFVCKRHILFCIQSKQNEKQKRMKLNTSLLTRLTFKILYLSVTNTCVIYLINRWFFKLSIYAKTSAIYHHYFHYYLIKNTFRNSLCDIDIYIFIYVYERICLNEFSRSKSSKLLQQFPPILPLRENYLSNKLEIKIV